jgi:hypothetical protein
VLTDKKRSLPNFDGYRLAQIELSSIDCTTLAFCREDENATILKTQYIHLYYANFTFANFECNPDLERTDNIELSFDDETSRWVLNVTFVDGSLQYKFKDFSFFEYGSKNSNSVQK